MVAASISRFEACVGAASLLVAEVKDFEGGERQVCQILGCRNLVGWFGSAKFIPKSLNSSQQ